MDDDIDRHFGAERAHYERETALRLLKGGNVGLSTVAVRNVKSDLELNKRLIVFKFKKCMSKERGILHTKYMVFENKEGGDYITSPASYCTCENGASFCLHLLCFLYVMRCMQVSWRVKRQHHQIEELMPEDRRIVHSIMLNRNGASAEPH